MRSSITEADYGDEDPFSTANSAFRAFLQPRTVPNPSGWSSLTEEASIREDSQTGDKTVCASVPNDTQSSMTQVDEEEEDPFPTLPPANSKQAFKTKSASTETTSQQCISSDSKVAHHISESLVEDVPEATRSQNQRDLEQSTTLSLKHKSRASGMLDSHSSETQSSALFGSMPLFGSFGDSSQIFDLSPRFIHTTVHNALRGLSRIKTGDEDAVSSGDEPSVPEEVQDFFSIFDSQSQSQSQESPVILGSVG